MRLLLVCLLIFIQGCIKEIQETDTQSENSNQQETNISNNNNDNSNNNEDNNEDELSDNTALQDLNSTEICETDYWNTLDSDIKPSNQLRTINAQIDTINLTFKIPQNFKTFRFRGIRPNMINFPFEETEGITKSDFFMNYLEVLSPSWYIATFCAHKAVKEGTDKTGGIFFENPSFAISIEVISSLERENKLQWFSEFNAIFKEESLVINNKEVDVTTTVSPDGFGCWRTLDIKHNSNVLISITHPFSEPNRMVESEDCSNIKEKHKNLTEIADTIVQSLNTH